MSENDYLYYSPAIETEINSYSCKCICGGMKGCNEGTLSNILGASLAGKRRRYVGVLTEEEFLHDMNTLGNIHVNDSLFYIILSNNQMKMIEDYAKSLHYVVEIEREDNLYETKIVNQILENGKKTVLILSR